MRHFNALDVKSCVNTLRCVTKFQLVVEKNNVCKSHLMIITVLAFFTTLTFGSCRNSYAQIVISVITSLLHNIRLYKISTTQSVVSQRRHYSVVKAELGNIFYYIGCTASSGIYSEV